jgi:hypothetical protein
MRAALARVREAIGTARARQGAMRQAEDAAAATGMTGEELGRFRAWERAERGREQALAAEAERLARGFAGRREALVARRRDERQLELLRERAAERHSAAEQRATMALLDDLARRRQAEGR